jgi:hypothetical protein
MLNHHKKFDSQAENLSNTEKMGDQWLSSTTIALQQENVKFCIQLQQKLLASSESLKKSTYIYKTFKQFFYISNCFRVIHCQKRVFDLVPSPYCDILVQFSITFKTAITQRLFDKGG